MALYSIDIMTLFPETVGDMMNESILGRAQERGFIRVDAHQIRDFTTNKQKQVDDYPYGGGRGAVMQADPLYRCWQYIQEQYGTSRSRTIFLSPCGATFNQEKARQLLRDYDHLTLVCGHYEGIDQRFIDECVDEEISLGDFVLTGGEIPAMAVADAVCRMVPGVLPEPACYEEESHWNGLLEYPQYSRPASWHGREVPEVLRGPREGPPLAAEAVHRPHPPAPAGYLPGGELPGQQAGEKAPGRGTGGVEESLPGAGRTEDRIGKKPSPSETWAGMVSFMRLRDQVFSSSRSCTASQWMVGRSCSMAVEATFCLAPIFMRLRASSTPATTTPTAKIPRERGMLWVSLKK